MRQERATFRHIAAVLLGICALIFSMGLLRAGTAHARTKTKTRLNAQNLSSFRAASADATGWLTLVEQQDMHAQVPGIRLSGFAARAGRTGGVNGSMLRDTMDLQKDSVFQEGLEKDLQGARTAQQMSSKRTGGAPIGDPQISGKQETVVFGGNLLAPSTLRTRGGPSETLIKQEQTDGSIYTQHATINALRDSSEIWPEQEQPVRYGGKLAAAASTVEGPPEISTREWPPVVKLTKFTIGRLSGTANLQRSTSEHSYRPSRLYGVPLTTEKGPHKVSKLTTRRISDKANFQRSSSESSYHPSQFDRVSRGGEETRLKRVTAKLALWGEGSRTGYLGNQVCFHDVLFS